MPAIYTVDEIDRITHPLQHAIDGITDQLQNLHTSLTKQLQDLDTRVTQVENTLVNLEMTRAQEQSVIKCR